MSAGAVDGLAEIQPVWVHDCQGKQDYDAEVIRLSCRFYPRGGGFSILSSGTWSENEDRPEIRPSAIAHILWGEIDELSKAEFEGESEADVKAQVENWARVQIAAIRMLVVGSLQEARRHD